jgi:hypothetical protein
MRLYTHTLDAARALHAQAEEVYMLAKELEELTKDTHIKHPGIQVRVEASVTRSQVVELLRALDELGDVLRGRGRERDHGEEMSRPSRRRGLYRSATPAYLASARWPFSALLA